MCVRKRKNRQNFLVPRGSTGANSKRGYCEKSIFSNYMQPQSFLSVSLRSDTKNEEKRAASFFSLPAVFLLSVCLSVLRMHLKLELLASRERLITTTGNHWSSYHLSQAINESHSLTPPGIMISLFFALFHLSVPLSPTHTSSHSLTYTLQI